jgi:hypothetical protein
VDPRFVQRILSEALATTLEEGFRSLPFGSGAGGVLGSLTRRAGRIPFANPFADQARALAQQSAESLRQRLMDQFEAPENAPEVAAMRARCADRLLALPTPQVLGLLNDPGWPTVAQWLRDVLAHNSAREAFQEAITEQVQSAFDRIGPDATLGEWLAPFELTTPFRSFLIDQSTELLVTLAGQTSLRQWLQNLLHSAKAE